MELKAYLVREVHVSKPRELEGGTQKIMIKVFTENGQLDIELFAADKAAFNNIRTGQ